MKKSIIYLVGLILVYALCYSVYKSFSLLENGLEGNDIIQPELKNIGVDEGKAQNLLIIMLVSYLALSTYFVAGFIKSVIKAVIGIKKKEAV